MNRSQLRTIINSAHDALHAGDIEAAHNILHGGVGDVESMTQDPEAQEAAAAFLRLAEGELCCGHKIGDLIGGKDAITQCGACVAARQASKSERKKEPLVIQLGFNPGLASPEVQAIFSDATARKLWCLWKRGHVVSQHFDGNVAIIAAEIDCKKPQTLKELRACFPFFSCVDFSDRDVDAWLEDHARFFMPPYDTVKIVAKDGEEVRW
jgi:hypothetical protein